MSVLDEMSVLILTFNEEENIARTLSVLGRFNEVIVLDSCSTDRTAEIVARFPNAILVTRPFDQHATQWNYGLGLCTGSWVLALDADYIVPPALVDELEGLAPSNDVAGYRVAFRYVVHGRPLRGTLYPAVTALYRRALARYIQQGHTQRVVVDGRIGELKARIDHDDRKPLVRWIASQQNYARLEIDHILALPKHERRWVDRVRLTGWAAPPIVFLYTLIGKRCLLDGWPGWFYTLQRTTAECLMALAVNERRLRGMIDQ